MQVQTRVDVFEMIFLVFLGLGTLVGAVVIAYTLYNAYKYRDEGETSDGDDVPTLGELPTGGKGGKKLFVSFGLSAIIVISLIIWTYGWLLYVEDGPQEAPKTQSKSMSRDGRSTGDSPTKTVSRRTPSVREWSFRRTPRSGSR